MAMTMASRGRSTKIAESIASASADGRLHRIGHHRRTRSHALQAIDDDQLAALETLADDDTGPGRSAGLDASYDRLAVLDHEDINAFLVGDERGLRHHHLFFRRADLDL